MRRRRSQQPAVAAPIVRLQGRRREEELRKKRPYRSRARASRRRRHLCAFVGAGGCGDPPHGRSPSSVDAARSRRIGERRSILSAHARFQIRALWIALACAFDLGTRVRVVPAPTPRVTTARARQQLREHDDDLTTPPRAVGVSSATTTRSPGADASVSDSKGQTTAAHRTGTKVQSDNYDRRYERWTWKDVLYPHRDIKKRHKILPPPRLRDTDTPGNCVLFSVSTAVEAAFRASGVKVGQLSWQYIGEMIREDAHDRIFEALRVLKYHGIMQHADFKKGNVNARRYKIHQFYQMGDPDNVATTPQSTLDKHIIKEALDNVLKKSVLIGRIPISLNYYDLEDGEYIYSFDGRCAALVEDLVETHSIAVTGFGFDEDVPFFEFLDCNGNGFSKEGFGRVSPISVIELFGFDICLD